MNKLSYKWGYPSYKATPSVMNKLSYKWGYPSYKATPPVILQNVKPYKKDNLTCKMICLLQKV
jgi:hypothetical protein